MRPKTPQEIADAVIAEVMPQITEVIRRAVAKHADAPPKELLSAEELAALKGVHPRTVRNWRSRGCPCHRVTGRKIAFRPSEVDHWLTEQKP